LNVEEISIVRKWKATARLEGLLTGRWEGRLQARREDLLLVLRTRFSPELPFDLVQAVNSSMNLEQLSRWFQAALERPSLEAFCSAVQLPAPGGP
jgi:hypothetical protein